MSEKNSLGNISKESVRDSKLELTELVIPLVSSLFAIYYLSTIWSLPTEARMNGTLLSASVFLLSFFLLIRYFLKAKYSGIVVGIKNITGTPKMAIKRLGGLLIMISYVVLMPVLGYLLCTLLFFMATVFILGGSSIKTTIIFSAVMSLIGYIVFIFALGVSLPHGVLENIMPF